MKYASKSDNCYCITILSENLFNSFVGQHACSQNHETSDLRIQMKTTHFCTTDTNISIAQKLSTQSFGLQRLHANDQKHRMNGE